LRIDETSPAEAALIRSAPAACYTCIARERFMLAIRLPEEIEARLDKLARSTGRTKSYYVREAILHHLDELEDIYEAEKRLEAIKAGKTKLVPVEKIMKRYGLDH